jgi:hypothetical protein
VTTQIHVEIIDGNAFVSEDDKYRAESDGRKVRVRLDADATGLFTAGTGDLVVRSA